MLVWMFSPSSLEAGSHMAPGAEVPGTLRELWEVIPNLNHGLNSSQGPLVMAGSGLDARPPLL